MPSSARGLADSGGELGNLLRSYNDDPGQSRSKSAKTVNFDLKMNMNRQSTAKPVETFRDDSDEGKPFKSEKETKPRHLASNSLDNRSKARGEYPEYSSSIPMVGKNVKESDSIDDSEPRPLQRYNSSSARKEDRPASKSYAENKVTLSRMFESTQMIKEKYSKGSTPSMGSPGELNSFRQSRWRDPEDSEGDSLLDESVRASRGDEKDLKYVGKPISKNMLDASRNSVGNINNSMLNTSNNSVP